MEEIWKDVPEELARIIRDAMECEDAELTICAEGADVVLETVGELCFSYRLHLTDAAGLPEEVGDGWLAYCKELSREESGYRLSGYCHSPDWEEEQEFVLDFQGFSAEAESVCPELGPNSFRPWLQLGSWAAGLVRKARIVPQLLNEGEKAILPLMQEIYDLFWLHITDSFGKDFHLLRGRFTPELNRELDRLLSTKGNWKRYVKAEERFRGKLERLENLTIWQSIRDAFVATQEAAPHASKLPGETIRRIEQQLHGSGYTGHYPDFIKTGEIRGLRVAKSHEMPYFVAREKHVVSYIHCRECLYNGELVGMEFLCGTELVKNGEKPSGIDACRFRSKGRTFWRSVQWHMVDEPYQSVRIASKKAELRSLRWSDRPKSERKEFWLLFFLTFVFGGGAFAVFMTLGMAAVSMLIAVLVGGWSAVPKIFGEVVPWLQLFLFCWLGFGGTMGILEAVAFWNE